MRNRIIVAVLVVVGLGLAALAWSRKNAATTTTMATPANPATTTTAATATPAKPKSEVAIQDGKTLDFSSGLAVVKDTEKEKAIIAKAEKEMADAAKGVTFTPAPSVVENKKAEPSPAPPKP